MSTLAIAITFLILIIFGFILESIIFQPSILTKTKKLKTYHYKLGRYLFYLVSPILAFIYVLFATSDIKLVYVFITFSILGTLLELLAGFAYHMVVGQKLWTYHRHSVGGYTSFLSVPLWGIGGVLFWLLVQIF